MYNGLWSADLPTDLYITLNKELFLLTSVGPTTMGLYTHAPNASRAISQPRTRLGIGEFLLRCVYDHCAC